MAVQVTRTGVAFTVGVILLAAAAFAGLYFVQQHGEQARRDEAIKVAEERLQAENDQTVSIDGGATEEVVVEEEVAVAETDNQATDNSSVAQPQTEVGELPQTGPEVLSALLSVGALTYATAAYLRSRRALL